MQHQIDRLNKGFEGMYTILIYQLSSSTMVSGQEEHLKELRHTHQLELASQSDQIEKLRTQLHEAEALLKAAEGADTIAAETATKQKAEIDRLQQEIGSAKAIAKEEEEKRVKAISLLKTVRQKLVKAEKDRDDTLREVTSLKERERSDKGKDEVERIKLQSQIDGVMLEKEKALDSLKTRFESDLAKVKETYEKDISILKGQLELEGVTLKVRFLNQSGSYVANDYLSTPMLRSFLPRLRL